MPCQVVVGASLEHHLGKWSKQPAFSSNRNYQKLARNYPDFFPQMPANCHKCQIDLTDYIKKSIAPLGAKS